MHAWDLEGWEPHEFLDHIVAAGLDEIRLALAYHGGRVLLPRNRRHLVYEQHESAVYFEPERGHYGRLQPAQGPHTAVVSTFLQAAASRNFPVRAWVVLTHNDWMGRQHPDCCIRNYRNEAYSYALCPAQPDVQEYILALIRDVSRLPGIVGLPRRLSQAARFAFGRTERAWLSLRETCRGLLCFPRCITYQQRQPRGCGDIARPGTSRHGSRRRLR